MKWLAQISGLLWHARKVVTPTGIEPVFQP